MSVHPDFVEDIRCRLVNPRRNIRRAIERLEAAGMGSGTQDWTALDYARESLDAIVDLEAVVALEETRATHTCGCGHVHYAQGEAT